MFRFWDRFFFVEQGPLPLAAFRLCYYLAAICYAAVNTMSANHSFPPELAISGIVGGISMVSPSAEAASLLLTLLYFFLVLAAVGLFSPLSKILVFLLSFYLYGVPYAYATIHEIESPIVISHFIMIFAPSEDALSVDNLIRKWLGWSTRPKAKLYAWPVQTIRLYFVFLFFSAGIFKIVDGGLSWFLQDPLRIIFIRGHYLNMALAASKTVDVMLANPILTRLGSLATALLELSLPVILFIPRLAVIYIPAIIVFMLLIMFSFNFYFIYSVLPLLLAWLPWRRFFSFKEDPHSASREAYL